MTELERLTNEIFTECWRGGEPVSEEEAKEMAKMELAEKNNRRYEKSDAPRKKAESKRKIDKIKADLADRFIVAIENYGGTVEPLKTETEIHFELNEEKYTLKIIKHRPKK